MIRLRNKLFVHSLRLFDQAALAFSLFVTVALAKGVYSIPQVYIVFQREYKLFESVGLIVMLVAWTFVFNRFVKYDTNRFVSLYQQIYKHAKASTTTAFLLLLAGVIFKFETLGLQSIAIFWSLNLLLGILARIFVRISLALTRNVDANMRSVLIVGTNEKAVALAHKIESNSELGYKIIGFVQAPTDTDPSEGLNLLGPLDNLSRILETDKIDEIIIALPFKKNVETIFHIISLGHDLGIVVRFTPNNDYAKILKSLSGETFDGDYILTFFRESHVLQLLIKRIMDFAGSALLLILLSPLFALVALAVRLDSKGPIFFAQERVGMNKRRFKLLKFRSMVINAEELRAQLADQNEVDGPVFKIKKDPRITRVGRFIRKTSIDELPQLWNALIGDISLVGPRPPLFSEVKQYEWLFRKRISIKPGITCLWQVSGRNNLSFDEWMELDKQYIDNWSIWLDIKILLLTIPTVLLGRGAS
jgi:exopolysaccharide biosynthesis polyprenyl glycosylphosphotransferase